MPIRTVEVVIALIGGGFALAANLVYFTMIGQINQKVPDRQKVDLISWGPEVKKKHRALYPDSKLVSVVNALTWLVVVSFLVLIWFNFH